MQGVSLATKGHIVYAKGRGPHKGEIEIEPNVWQLLVVPVAYGYFDTNTGKIVNDKDTPSTIKNYVMDQIEYIEGNPAENYVEIANAYIGDENAYRGYIPGLTDPDTTQNFPLGYIDGDKLEYTAFWIKSIHNSTITIEWRE